MSGISIRQRIALELHRQLVKDIEATDTSETAILDVQTLVLDKPQALFVLLLICLGGYMIICRMMRV